MGATLPKEKLDDQLTCSDIELIKITWDSVKDKKTIGIKTMIRVLTHSQEIKNLWIFANNLETEEDMLNNAQLKYHAEKVINTLEKIILLSDSSAISEKDKERLVTLGKNHYHYGLKKEYFKVFEDSFIKSLAENFNDQEINFHEVFDNAWRKFIQYIFKRYTDGMEIEKEGEIKTNDLVYKVY